jgi:hypothetical protein
MPTVISGTSGIDKVVDGSINPSVDIAYNQTWQTVTRSNATNYTNTSGQPIDVCISVNTVNGTYISISVGGLNLATAQVTTTSNPANLQLYARVPAGAIYRTDGTATINSWMELR